MQPEWALSVYRQCKAAGVAFFFKQLGSAFDYSYDHERLGFDWDEMVLCARELPAVTL
jgi:protein gp37